MAKNTTQAAKTLPKKKAVLNPVAQAPANNNVLPAAGPLKLSEVSKPMRNLIRERAKQANNGILTGFKQELKNPAATEVSIRATLTPSANSTIKTGIQFNGRTILKTSLSKPLRKAYNEAEAEMKAVLTEQYQEQFQARQVHTLAQLKELDELCRKAGKPFKGKFM